MLVLAALVLIAVAGLLVLGPGPALWTARATLDGAADAAAWRHVPRGRPLVLACDVPRLMASPIATNLRPELEALAARHGFDTTLAEANVRSFIVSAESPEQVHAVASGFRMSPLLLARFVEPWQVVPFGKASAGGGGRRAATDGMTLLVPLEPGLVAWVPSGVDPGRVAASLESASGASEEPLALGDDVLRARLVLDDRLRLRARQALPREAMSLINALQRADIRVAAGDRLDVSVDLAHRDAASAQATAALLVQANTAAMLLRGAGSLAALLGPDAALLALLPPLTVQGDGETVRVKASADAGLATRWIAEAEKRFSR